LDQAYDAFAEHPLGTPALPDHDHVLHLRSLTKEHALAGIRVAFAVAAPDIINALERSRVPWAASSIAQAAAVAAMSDDAMAYVAETTRALRAEKSRVVAMCNAMSLSVSSSSTHFITIRCDDGRAARERLLHRHSILVRDCASFGLPEWIRVAARTTTETDALIASLESLLDVSGEFHHLGTIKSS
jgi:histidinol-phosphate/aromatic aminotransferase/cobyric acid decarboxylase-like protein